MSECSLMRETMPFLLTESIDRNQRELTHQHIESCAECGAEWDAYRETWGVLGELPEVEVPARVRSRFLSAVKVGDVEHVQTAPSNVVPFHRRSAAKWVAQAAAVVVLVGGAYFAGNRTAPVRLAPSGPQLTSVQPYSIAETRVLPANAISPDIEGRPNIQNVHFVDDDASDNSVGVSFDVTSRVTVNGAPSDKSMVRLLTYVLENEQSLGPSRSRAIEWVKQTYSDPGVAQPEIANALAKLLRNEEHEGVRIRAVDTLKTLTGTGSSATREALIEALKSDPNPAVRIKAVEALANMAAAGSQLDPLTLDTLRQKAAQDDENLYVRVKAAEVLSNMRPQ
jgi:hypothetical protein